MALWGNSDNLGTSPTPVTVVGTASSEFWTAEAATPFAASGIGTGNTILLGTPAGSEGFLVIETLLSPTLAKCGKMSGVGTDVNASFDAAYSEQPIFLKNDPGYAPSSADGNLDRTQLVAGINTATSEAVNATAFETGVGWVGVTTYMSLDPETGISTMRVKKEVYVAMSSIEEGNRDYPTDFGG